VTTTETYWRSYLATLPDAGAQPKGYVAEAFGDSAALADELASLIALGKKTATCSTLWEWEAEGNPIPAVGLVTIVLDGRGAPVSIIETTQVWIVPFDGVDEVFAAEEGEGDQTLEYWRRAHWGYFSRTLGKIGKEPAPDMPLVCERFRVMYR